MTLARAICFLALCALAAGLTFKGETNRADAFKKPNVYGDVLDATPEQYPNFESLPLEHPIMGFTIKLKGISEAVKETYMVEINATTMKIYVPSAEPPSPEETRIPDNDDVENIRVYFANEEGRTLEVRFNRFEQSLVRLWKHPYGMLRDDGSANFVSTVTTGDKYSMIVRVPAELMPANVTRVHGVVVDPTQEGGFKYFSYYRLYNYPIAYDWNMMVYQMFKEVDLYALVPESINKVYSTWWDGLTK
ncbi:Hypothetical predicted protein [Cloeon dipterum]|uniref:Uncharacterized protein n=2 Tax=Cloeon dipterum TaxID=197152 RepID=A0A8S1BRJ1_9INSE|nr:Hypothetical predicted protein [Cloeon dipterum]